MREDEAKLIVHRVLNGNGSVAGTAFLIDDDWLLTCAHVVATALGRGLNGNAVSGEKVKVDAPCSVDKSFFEATVEFFEASRDVALLRMPSERILGSIWPAAWLCGSTQQDQSEVRAFGFPDGYPNGGWPEGKLNLSNAQGWIEVDRLNLLGVPVIGGMSGSPVWRKDLMGTIGMLAASDPTHGVFYVIPFDLIRQTCQEKVFFRLVSPDEQHSDQFILKTLFKLDYQEQKQAFFRFHNKRVCSYILQGEKEFGQELLMRFFYKMFDCKAVGPLKIDFGVTSRSGTYQDLLHQLGLILSLRSVELKQIILALRTKLQFSDVVIWVNTGYLTGSDGISSLFREFWYPVAQELASYRLPYRLAMFILDNYKQRNTWKDIKTANNFGWAPEIPVELPKIEKFSIEILKTFMMNISNSLSYSIDSEFIAERIYQYGNQGIPERVFNQFCRLFNRNWYGDIEQCLKI